MIRNLKTNRYIKYNTDYFHKLLKQHTKNDPIFKSADLRKLRSMQNAGADEQDYCPICLEVPYSKCLKLKPCSHVICKNCIESWCYSTITDYDNNDICTCPICREPIKGHLKTEHVPLKVTILLDDDTIIYRFLNYFRNGKKPQYDLSYENINNILYHRMVGFIYYYLPNSISDPQSTVNVIKNINLGGHTDYNADLHIDKNFDFVLLINYYSHYQKIIDEVIEKIRKTNYMYKDKTTKQPLWKITFT